MLVYHGASSEIISPNISFSRTKLDFGKGFYVAKDFEQAKKWAQRFTLRKLPGIVNTYEIDMDTVEKQYKTLTFEEYDEKWLEFIVGNRMAKEMESFDLISGGIANDKVFNTVELYLENLISEKEALGRLQYQKPNWQICIRNQEIIENHLVFQKSEEC